MFKYLYLGEEFSLGFEHLQCQIQNFAYKIPVRIYKINNKKSKWNSGPLTDEMLAVYLSNETIKTNMRTIYKYEHLVG